MPSKNCFLLCLLLLLLGNSAFAQDPAILKIKGEQLYQSAYYGLAIKNFEAYHQMVPDDDESQYLLGLCFYFNNEISKAKTTLNQLLNTIDSPFENLYYNLGRIYHAENDFEEAVGFYKSFLRITGPDDTRRSMVKDEIRRCGFGLKTKGQSIAIQVENLGDTINSEYDEFAPILSPNHEGKLYFSAVREDNLGNFDDSIHPKNINSDMFSTSFENGEWSSPSRMSFLLNSPQNDILLDLSSNGTELYFFRGDQKFSGDVFVDTFQQSISDRALANKEFKSPMKSWEGDCMPYFFDKNTLLFASRRKGGYGGLDLYISVRESEGWSKPKNLGAPINTSYDETSPFLAKNGRTIYFSTNNPFRSIGGLDICKSTFYDSNKIWSDPVNLKLPINSAGDEEYFKITQDGKKAFFSSSRKEGFGERDIYVAIFEKPQKEHLLASEPALFLDLLLSDKQAINSTKHEEKSATFSNGSNTNAIKKHTIEPLFYEMKDEQLSEENKAKLQSTIALLHEFPQIDILLTGHSDNSLDQKNDLFVSIKKAELIANHLIENGVAPSRVFTIGVGKDFPVALNLVGDKLSLKGQTWNRRIDIFLAHTDTEGLPIQIDYSFPTIEESLQTGGLEYFMGSIKNLSYKVQFASLKELYQGELTLKYPNAMVDSSADSDIYNFTIGIYQTFQSANLLQKDLLRQGIQDAKVVAYINGQRLTKEAAKQYVDFYPDLENYVE